MKDLAPHTADTTRVARAFRRGLASYHDAAQVQEQIATELAQMLAAHAQAVGFDRSVEFGAGTGHLTNALLQRFLLDQLWLNDLVDQAEHGLQPVLDKHSATATFLAGPIETLVLPPQLDLIAAASVVQWIPDLPLLLHRCASALKPGGWLALSSFGTAHFQELVALGSQTGAPNYMDRGAWARVLPPQLDCVEIRQSLITLTFESPRAVLRHLRATGVNGQSRGGWTRAQLAIFEDRYKELFSVPGGVRLTYDPVMVLAQKR
ncbi:methyltransferase domain-containing protein [Phaeobacter sp.]|uniref:methyltransferase domain-containing protein n=1 Tax=Phaeobacter sp. TaxID=1902409 RepID=UPI0025F38792|nr:methyltransferase domain-containing protein [Phaeobacter sp.]